LSLGACHARVRRSRPPSGLYPLVRLGSTVVVRPEHDIGRNEPAAVIDDEMAVMQTIEIPQRRGRNRRQSPQRVRKAEHVSASFHSFNVDLGVGLELAPSLASQDVSDLFSPLSAPFLEHRPVWFITGCQ